MSKVIDETGNQYGYLTVLERAGSKSGKAAWRCKCDCGNETVVTGDNLRQGKTISCGCAHIESARKVGHANAANLKGRRFGKLTALKPIGSVPYGGVLWYCQCDCGNFHKADSGNLLNGRICSCGCLVSKGEQEIQRLLIEYEIVYKTQYSPDGWYLSTGYKPFYDFGIFDKGQLLCLLEFHGEQHRKFYNNKKTWNNKENFEKTIRRDKEKQQLCINNNIPLYIIWYDDDINKSLLKILEEENLIFDKTFDIM